MRTRGALLILVLFFLFPALVSAQSFDYQIKPVVDSITPVEQAQFDVIITNNQEVEDTFRLSAPDILWSVQSDPLFHYFSGIKIGPLETKTVRLLINPAGARTTGITYRVELSITSSNTAQKENTALFLKLTSGELLVRDYLAAVQRIVEIPDDIDPREPFDIKVNVANRNPNNISNLTVMLDSELFTRSFTTTLGALEKKTLETTVKLDPSLSPRSEKLFITFIADGEELRPTFAEDFEIISYSDIRVEEKPVEKSFLKTTRTYVYTNEANVEVTQRIEQPSFGLASIFTKTNPESFNVKEGDNSLIAWDFTFAPNESKTVVITTNYMAIFIVAVLIIIATGLYLFFRSSVLVTKAASIISLNEGGISEIKLIIHVKNRANKNFERVTIVDKLPNITDVEKEVDVGTLKPSSVSHGKEGTVIKWDLDNLDRFEERILSYKVRSRLSILGGFDLPPVTVIFHDDKGNKYYSKSRKVKISD